MPHWLRIIGMKYLKKLAAALEIHIIIDLKLVIFNRITINSFFSVLKQRYDEIKI